MAVAKRYNSGERISSEVEVEVEGEGKGARRTNVAGERVMVISKFREVCCGAGPCGGRLRGCVKEISALITWSVVFDLYGAKGEVFVRGSRKGTLASSRT